MADAMVIAQMAQEKKNFTQSIIPAVTPDELLNLFPTQTGVSYDQIEL